MTEETPQETPAQIDPDEYWEERDRAQPDQLLAVIVETANDGDATFGITLTVRGAHISGIVTDRHAWLDAIQERFGDAVNWTEGFRKMWRDHEERTAHLTESMTPPFERFIHLVNARFLSGERIMPENGGFWRGRLSEIDGWALGVLEATAVEE